MSSPTADRTSVTVSMVSSAGSSISPGTALCSLYPLYPCSTREAARRPSSRGVRSRRIELAYTFTLSRILPPEQFADRDPPAPSPLMSQKAMSSPAMAQNTAPPISSADPASIMSRKRRPVSNGSFPAMAGARCSSTRVFVTPGCRRKHSPIPVIPSSVWTFTNGKSPSSIRHSTETIFIG